MYTYISSLLGIRHRLRTGRRYEKTTITIHSTGNDTSTPEGERRWLDNPENTRDASWHYCVGEKKVICALPEEEESWHCAVTDGNRHSISVEIVESGNRALVLNTAAEFVADTLKRYGWGVDRLKRHYDWNGKNCPRILIDKALIKDNLNWNWFVKTVEEYLKPEEANKVVPQKVKMFIDGKTQEIECVNVNGYNYVKIRDIAPKLGYSVGSSGKTPVLFKL